MDQQPSCRPIEGGKLCRTPAEALALFLHDGIADESERTMAIASFTLSLWQSTHGPITPTVPSVLLVHASDSAVGDPIDAFAGDFVFYSVCELERRLKQQEEKEKERTLACPGDPGPAMKSAVQSVYHGDGPAYRYCRAWSDKHGWLSGADSRMVLRLDQPEDLKALRKDLLSGSDKLRDPKGIDHDRHMVSKQLALSGSLPGQEWDRPLVDALLNGGWPVLFLPHSAHAPIEIPYSPDLHLACMQVAAAGFPYKQVTAELVLPDDPRIQHHHRALMKRLVHMPMDFSYNTQRILRELRHVCFRIARVICEQGGGPNALILIAEDLFRSTLRAVVIGVASLAYHGWGFDAGVSRERVQQLLEHLRTNGPQTRRALQRKFPQWLETGKRDALLNRLDKEGLVYCPDKVVTAVPLSEYIQWLHRQPEFPVEGCLSSLLLDKKCRQEAPLPGPPLKKRRVRKPKVAVKAAEPETAEKPTTGEAADVGEVAA
jgi:hypothetical protein